jgi:hypothetical protein
MVLKNDRTMEYSVGSKDMEVAGVEVEDQVKERR